MLVAAADKAGAERKNLLDEAITLNLELAESIARRYSDRGIDGEDLVQAASLGLVNAARRFDPNRGTDFASFAVPTITGEVKRYFRDHGWSVRPPRRVQELQAAISAVSPKLTQRLGASPSADDLAEHLGADVDDIREASASHEFFTTHSLDSRGPSGEGTPLTEALGDEDRGFDRAEAVVALAPACHDLSRRDRDILYMRFFRGWTQQEIADDLGVTQMQVSRLIARILAGLRADFGVPEHRKPRRARRVRRTGPNTAEIPDEQQPWPGPPDAH